MRKKRILSFAVAVAATFSMATPAMADMTGVDVSDNQSSSITREVSTDFAFIKVSQSNWYTSRNWQEQVAGAEATGKDVGLYAYAGGNDPTSEADYFLARANPYVHKAVLGLDWESGENVAFGNGNWVRTFVNRIHARTGVWPVIYVQASALGQIPSDVKANCGIWVAQYASNSPTGLQARPWNYGAYGEALRQYSSNGWVNGYGPLDLDLFRGDRTAWSKYANPTNSPAPVTPAPAPAPAPSRSYVVVRSGDCLSTLFGSSWSSVAARNGIRYPYTIWPGEVIYTNGSSRTVVVRSGDNLSSIAAREGVSVSAIHGYRSGNPNLIYPGEVLSIN